MRTHYTWREMVLFDDATIHDRSSFPQNFTGDVTKKNFLEETSTLILNKWLKPHIYKMLIYHV